MWRGLSVCELSEFSHTRSARAMPPGCSDQSGTMRRHKINGRPSCAISFTRSASGSSALERGCPLIAFLMALERHRAAAGGCSSAAYVAHTRARCRSQASSSQEAIGSWIGRDHVPRGALAGAAVADGYGRYFDPPDKIERQKRGPRVSGCQAFRVAAAAVIRHLIGIPAGIVRMPYVWFSVAARGQRWCSVPPGSASCWPDRSS
jgi:hypothetical protein